MTDLVLSSIFIHNVSLFVLVFLIVYHFYVVTKIEHFVVMAKKLKFTTPLFHSINAFTVYTGMVLSAYSRIFDLTTIIMIIASLFLMISEIKRYKKMRVITSSDETAQNEFKIFAKKIYASQLVVIFAIYVISKIF